MSQERYYLVKSVVATLFCSQAGSVTRRAERMLTHLTCSLACHKRTLVIYVLSCRLQFIPLTKTNLYRRLDSIYINICVYYEHTHIIT